MPLISLYVSFIFSVLFQDAFAFSQKYSIVSLERNYNSTYEVITDTRKKINFEESLKIYSYFMQNREEIFALKLLQSEVVQNNLEKRFQILLNRPLNMEFQKENEKNISKLISRKNKIGEWKKINQPSSHMIKSKIKSFETERNKNHEKLSEQRHQKLVNFIEESAKNIASFKENDLKKLIILIQNRTEDSSLEWEDILLDNKDLVLQKDLRKKEIQPLNTYAPYFSKYDYLIELIRHINENPNSLNPILLSSYVLQTVISLNPIETDSHVLARLLSDYVLIKNGFLPLVFDSEDYKKYPQLAVFPLNEFNKQVKPDEVLEVVLRGLENSYDIFEEIIDNES